MRYNDNNNDNNNVNNNNNSNNNNINNNQLCVQSYELIKHICLSSNKAFLTKA